MGIHGNSTCVMNYDGATGWLVGEEMKGLAAMFIMMNAARLGVGLQGLGVAEIAYQNAVALCAGPPPGPRADRRRRSRSEKADHAVRPSRRPPHADGGQGADRGAARAVPVGRAAGRSRACRARPRRSAQLAADLVGLLTPVIKGYRHRQGLRDRDQRAAGLWRPRLHRRMGHGAVSSAMPGSRRSTKAPTASRRWTWSAASSAQNGGRAVQALLQAGRRGSRRGQGRSSDRRLRRARWRRRNGELQAATMWFMQNGMTNPNNVGAGALSATCT